MSNQETRMTPIEIRLNKDKTALSISYDTGESYQLTAEFLRVYSPSAEVKGHGDEPRKIVPNKKNVRIADIQMVGNYAVKLIFDDGHDTGLYSWSYLNEIGQNHDALWQDYLVALENARLSR